ncbi:MAG: MerR family transcriptional regulator [Acidimicrobiia bacterium]
MSTHTVGDVAAMAGLTVRTLHHYDDIGLLVASARSSAGYRLYNDNDIDRLQTILTYRELGLSLDEIALIVDDQTDALQAMTVARDRIIAKVEWLQTVVANLARSINHHKEGIPMTPEEKLSVFEDFDPAEHQEEANDRWGGTPEYAESTRRTSSYTAEDWKAINAEADSIYDGFATLMRSNVAPSDEEARNLVDDHRGHISRWFYTCSPEVHSGLGQMYVADQRFAQNIDKRADGLADYLAKAIAARYG